MGLLWAEVGNLHQRQQWLAVFKPGKVFCHLLCMEKVSPRLLVIELGAHVQELL
jgi:hypothetical protein